MTPAISPPPHSPYTPGAVRAVCGWAAGKLPPSEGRLYRQAVKASDYNNAFRINQESRVISHYSGVRT